MTSNSVTIYSTGTDGDQSASDLIGFVDEPPAHLSADQGDIFRYLVSVLLPLKIIDEPDRPALSELAIALDEIRKTTAELEAAGGMTYELETGMGQKRIILHPLVAVRDAAKKTALLYFRQFGMTPASRKGIQPGDAGDQGDLFAEFGIL